MWLPTAGSQGNYKMCNVFLLTVEFNLGSKKKPVHVLLLIELPENILNTAQILFIKTETESHTIFIGFCLKVNLGLLERVF